MTTMEPGDAHRERVEDRAAVTLERNRLRELVARMREYLRDNGHMMRDCDVRALSSLLGGGEHGSPTGEFCENVCEHGDHPAPLGVRFCSDACRRCERESEGGCDNICGGNGAP